MTTEEELKDLKKRFDEHVSRTKREKMTTAVVFGVIAMTGLSALVYGFFQQTAAKKAQMLFERRGDEAAQYILRADKAEQEAFTLRKRIQVEIEKVKTCEKAVAELQSKIKIK